MNTPGTAATAMRRFIARSSRDALRLVREALGADAVVVSNRITSGGVEVLAHCPESAAPVLEVQALPAEAPVPAHEPTPQPLRERAPQPVHEPSRVPVREPVRATATADDDLVLRELLSMRGMIEEQLAGRSWSDAQRRDPLRGHLLRVLLGAGFSARLARGMLDALPEGLAYAQGLDWLRAQLAGRLPLLADDQALLDEGGVYALVGPTGVGKTTTTAKLAARCVMRFGPQKLALVTTDCFRIGAYEQLRIYGQILGVPVHAVKDATDLRLVLEDLRDKHMVLIDTVGMSQRDRAVSDQVAMLRDAARPVRRLLLLNATSHGDTLDEVVHAYSHGGTRELAGCIITKIDEATHRGAVLDTAIRHDLAVHYVCGGQKVPEDLDLPESAQLVESLFGAGSRTAFFVPGELDVPAEVAALRTEADAAQAQSVALRLRTQCQQLVRALASDARELAVHAKALETADIGFEGVRALWRSLAAGDVPADMAQLPTGRMLAVPGDAHAPGAALLLSSQSGLPLATVAAHALPEVPLVLLPAELPSPMRAAAWEAAGRHWVARASARMRVLHAAGQACKLSTLAGRLRFGAPQPADLRGRHTLQSLAQTQVRWLDGGAPLRLVVVRTNDAKSGKLLSEVFLLASEALDASPAELLQWQAWRQAVRPCFKLMKEARAQFSAASEGELTRAQVWLVGVASTSVWRLYQSQAAWAAPVRAMLAQLAGRRARPGRSIPAPVLFEGLGKFCVLLDALAADEAPLPQAVACA